VRIDRSGTFEYQCSKVRQLGVSTKAGAAFICWEKRGTHEIEGRGRLLGLEIRSPSERKI